MTVLQPTACPEVVQKVENFLQVHALQPGVVDAHVLLESDVYVAWRKATRTHAPLYSRVIPFETGAQAREAVQLLTSPAPLLG